MVAVQSRRAGSHKWVLVHTAGIKGIHTAVTLASQFGLRNLFLAEEGKAL